MAQTEGNVTTDYTSMPVEQIVPELQNRWSNFQRQLPTAVSGEVFQEAEQIGHLISVLAGKY